MNSTTNQKDHDMNGIESSDYATERLKFLGCNVFQILTAEEAAVLFSFHHGQGAKLHKLLIPAVHRGSDEFVRLLMASGVQPTHEAMLAWVARGRLRMLHHLLDAGGVLTFEMLVDVIEGHSYDEYDCVPQMEAALAKNRLLLSQQEKDRLLAVASGRGIGIEMHKLLIEGYGACVDVECQHGTPLIHACRNRNDELALYLIEQGADIDYKRPGKWSARTFVKSYKEVMPLTHARITRHELTKKADKKRKQIEVDAPMRRAM